MKFETLHKSKAPNSMVTNFFCNFWRLSILIPVSVGTCQFLGQSYGPKTANAWILMKFCALNKSMVANSMVTLVFCDSWWLSNLTLFNIGTGHLLGHIFKQELQELQFGEILYSAEIKDAEFSGDNCFLWFLMLVNFDLCQYWHLSCFRPQIWMKNGKCFNFHETLYSGQIKGAEFNFGIVNSLSLKF